jgi:hypothetical protein
MFGVAVFRSRLSVCALLLFETAGPRVSLLAAAHVAAPWPLVQASGWDMPKAEGFTHVLTVVLACSEEGIGAKAYMHV